jgi:hypothetical protein
MFQDMYIYCSFLASQQLSAVFHHITAATSCRYKNKHDQEELGQLVKFIQAFPSLPVLMGPLCCPQST